MRIYLGVPYFQTKPYVPGIAVLYCIVLYLSISQSMQSRSHSQVPPSLPSLLGISSLHSTKSEKFLGKPRIRICGLLSVLWPEWPARVRLQALAHPASFDAIRHAKINHYKGPSQGCSLKSVNIQQHPTNIHVNNLVFSFFPWLVSCQTASAIALKATCRYLKGLGKLPRAKLRSEHSFVRELGHWSNVETLA
jgi:hypothetical protein